MGSVGSTEPINFEKRVLEPINLKKLKYRTRAILSIRRLSDLMLECMPIYLNKNFSMVQIKCAGMAWFFGYHGPLGFDLKFATGFF